MGTDLLAPAGPELQSPDHKGHIQSANWHVSTNEVEFGHLTPRHQIFRGGGYYGREQDRQLPGDHGGPVIPHSA